MHSNADRWLFRIAALFNGLVAGSLFFAGDVVWPLLGMDPPKEPLLLHLFLVFVALFGAGYFWVSRDLTRNHALVGLGALGKTAAFCVIFAHFLGGTAPFSLVALIAPDLVFAGLFTRFLFRVRSVSLAGAHGATPGSAGARGW